MTWYTVCVQNKYKNKTQTMLTNTHKYAQTFFFDNKKYEMLGCSRGQGYQVYVKVSNVL